MNYSNTDSRLPRTVTFTDSELDRILQKILEEKPKSSRQAKASKQSPARAAVADENWQ
tara:strand:+ start:9098 stop:9271 length:174 start_codon:yes stop_codon:yes gene_type:complete